MKATLMLRAIECRYIGPTNYRGSRISVRWADRQGARKVYPWISELDQGENYEESAKRFYLEIADIRDGEELSGKKVRLEGGYTERGAVFCIRWKGISK
jgi:hypothetical protein